jgi:hypothetical protein
MKATGRKMAITATVAAVAAKVISRAPSSAARIRSLPWWKWRTMFSSTMMASSTTMPMARARASRVKVFRVNPLKYRMVKVPMMEVGMDRITLNPELQVPRNRKQMSAVSRRDQQLLLGGQHRLLHERVKSTLICSFMPSGSVCCSSAIRAFTAWPTFTSLDPRCLLMPMAHPGLAGQPGKAADVVQPVLHPRHVAHPDGGVIDGLPAARGDQDVAHLLRVRPSPMVRTLSLALVGSQWCRPPVRCAPGRWPAADRGW